MNFNAKTAAVWNGEEITKDMAKELGNEFYSVAGKIMISAKNKVPRATSRLSQSIRRRRPRDRFKPEAYVFAGNRKEGIYWHGFVEYGTAKMAARPYLRPAMDGSRSAIVSGATRGGRKVIKKPRRTVR